MGSVGDSFDNALAENLWVLVKTQSIGGRVFATRAEANLALFEYVDGLSGGANGGGRPARTWCARWSSGAGPAGWRTRCPCG